MTGLMRTGLLTLVMASTTVLRADEHPIPLDKKIDSAKCLECHDDKGKGAHVHSAIAMGCDSCHAVKVEKDTTFVELSSPREELCFSCHEKAKAQLLHGPYDKGGCVLCHDPHATDHENQLRAEGNALCLECHRDRSIGGEKAVLFNGSQELSAEKFAEIPKIGLDPTLKFGHPMGNHKVRDAVDPLHPGKKISCLSCHENHAAERESLVRTVEFKGKKSDACDACHSANDDERMAAAQKHSDELQAQREKEEKARAKQPSATPEKAPAPATKKSRGESK